MLLERDPAAAAGDAKSRQLACESVAGERHSRDCAVHSRNISDERSGCAASVRLGNDDANCATLAATEFVAEIRFVYDFREGFRDSMKHSPVARRSRHALYSPSLSRPSRRRRRSPRASACCRTSTRRETAADFDTRIPAHTFTAVDTSAGAPALAALTGAYDVMLRVRGLDVRQRAGGRQRRRGVRQQRARGGARRVLRPGPQRRAGRRTARTAGARSRRSTQHDRRHRHAVRAAHAQRRDDRRASADQRPDVAGPAPSSPAATRRSPAPSSLALLEAAQRARSARPRHRRTASPAPRA